jgi:hypothetical protein
MVSNPLPEREVADLTETLDATVLAKDVAGHRSFLDSAG